MLSHALGVSIVLRHQHANNFSDNSKKAVKLALFLKCKNNTTDHANKRFRGTKLIQKILVMNLNNRFIFSVLINLSHVGEH